MLASGVDVRDNHASGATGYADVAGRRAVSGFVRIRRAFGVVTVCILGPAVAGAQRSAPAVPSLILTGGKVFTSDSVRPWAEALAIRGDRVIAVGTTAEVRRMAGRGTREIPLAGRVVFRVSTTRTTTSATYPSASKFE